MNCVPVIVWNSAYVEELEPDEEVDPADPAPLISGNTPIITIPDSEDEEAAGEIVADGAEGVIQGLEELTQEIRNWTSPPCKDADSPIITVPASEDKNVTEDASEDDEEDVPQVLREAIQSLAGLNQELRSILSLRDTSSQKHTIVPNVDIWDTGKAVEQEYRLYPNPTRKGLGDRLDNQVWDLLRIIQERVDQGTCNNTDMRLVDGLNAISVMHARLGVLTEIALKRQARKP